MLYSLDDVTLNEDSIKSNYLEVIQITNRKPIQLVNNRTETFRHQMLLSV